MEAEYVVPDTAKGRGPFLKATLLNYGLDAVRTREEVETHASVVTKGVTEEPIISVDTPTQFASLLLSTILSEDGRLQYSFSQTDLLTRQAFFDAMSAVVQTREPGKRWFL